MDDDQSPPPVGRPVAGTEHSWCRAVAGGTGVTVVAILLSRPIPVTVLESAVHRLQLSHPLLRSRIAAASPADPGRPFLSVAATPPVSLLSVVPPPAATSFHSLLEHELNRNPWADPAGPSSPAAFAATAYELSDEEPGRRVLLALRFHPAVCDRGSASALLLELLGSILHTQRAGEGDEAEGEEGILQGMEDLIPPEDAWKPFWARGKDLLGYSINGLRTATLQFEDVEVEGRRSEVVRWAMNVQETQKLLDACKTRGIKLCAAISAAAMIAAHSSKNFEIDQNETYSILTLVDCRKYVRPTLNDHNIGSYHSAILNTHNIHDGEELWEVATRCHSSYSNAMDNKKHLKDVGDLNFLMCKAIDNPQLTPSSSQRTALISVFEEPVVYELSEFRGELGVEDDVSCASSHGVGPSIAFFDTIRDGQLHYTCVYPSPLHSREQIQEILEQMKMMLINGH